MALPTDEIWHLRVFASRRRSRSSLWYAPLYERRPAAIRTRSVRSTRCPLKSIDLPNLVFATRRPNHPDTPTHPYRFLRRTIDPRNWPTRFARSIECRTKQGWMRLGVRVNGAMNHLFPLYPNRRLCPRTLHLLTRSGNLDYALASQRANKWEPRWELI